MLTGALLLAAGLALERPLREAWWTADLLRAPPPDRLPVPVRGVAPADLADTWGDPRSGERRHEGIDIFAARRTPVVSASRGLVIRRGENPLGGRVLTVLGPGGWRHYYAHLEGWAGHARGDRVAAGEVIGFVGTSGNAPANAPHLHYGIYVDGAAINPFPLLAADPEGETPPPVVP